MDSSKSLSSIFYMLWFLCTALDSPDYLQHVGLEENMLVLGTFTTCSNAVKPSEFHLEG